MATDNSPPRIRIILTVAFSSLVILFTLNYVFRSYYLMMTEQVEQEHLAAPEQLTALRAAEQRNLTSSPLPIAQAMDLVAHGRTGEALKRYADITPEPSNDNGPLVGWILAPNMAAVERMNAAASATATDGGAPGDGGAQVTPGDAGAAGVSVKGSPDAGSAPTHSAASASAKPAPTSPRAGDAGAH